MARHGTRYMFKKGCDAGPDGKACAECAAANQRHNDDQNARRRAGQATGRPRVVDGRVRCSCGTVCASKTALGAHTWEKHDRPPTDQERTVLVAAEYKPRRKPAARAA